MMLSRDPAIDLHEIAVAEVSSQALLAAEQELLEWHESTIADHSFLDVDRVPTEIEFGIALHTLLLGMLVLNHAHARTE